MSSIELKEQINNFRKGDTEAFNICFNEFKKLIKYFSYKLKYEDASQELIMFFIEILYDIQLDKFKNKNEMEVQKYIAVALRNKYISLSKKNQEYNSSLNELLENNIGFYSIPDVPIYITEGLNKLTEKQRKIIVYRYIYNYTDCEISDMLFISRQAVNKMRNRGLSVLKNFYCCE